MLNKLIFWLDRKIVSRYLNRKGVRIWGLPFYFAMGYSIIYFKRAGLPEIVRGIMFLLGTWCVSGLSEALRVPSQPQEDSCEIKPFFNQNSFQDPLKQAVGLVRFLVILPIYILAYIIIWYLFICPKA